MESLRIMSLLQEEFWLMDTIKHSTIFHRKHYIYQRKCLLERQQLLSGEHKGLLLIVVNFGFCMNFAPCNNGDENWNMIFSWNYIAFLPSILLKRKRFNVNSNIRLTDLINSDLCRIVFINGEMFLILFSKFKYWDVWLNV